MMKIFWQPFANEGKRQIANYIRRQFGLNSKKIFMEKVDETARMLMSNPYIGAIDSYYSDRTFTYRSIIVNGLNKMVYRIDGDTIYIVDFWDTRREPQRQASKTE